MVRKYIALFLFFILFGGVATNAFADNQQQVLGLSAESSQLSLPGTAEGPGLILPDSPLFFLDELKQKARVAMALTPEAKLKVHTAIAGERLAELRIMAARGNYAAIETDLRGLEDNLIAAADDLQDANLSGKTTTEYARETNTTLKRIQLALDILEDQASGNTKARVAVSQQALLGAKVKVEGRLPKDEMDNEFRDDVKWMIKRKMKETAYSVMHLKELLKHEGNTSADQKSLDAVLKAVEDMQKPTPTASPSPTKVVPSPTP